MGVPTTQFPTAKIKSYHRISCKTIFLALAINMLFAGPGFPGDLCLIDFVNRQQFNVADNVVTHAYGRIDGKFIVYLNHDQITMLGSGGIEVEILSENADLTRFYIVSEPRAGAVKTPPSLNPVFSTATSQLIETDKSNLDAIRNYGYMVIPVGELNTPIFYQPLTVSAMFPSSFPGDTIADLVNQDSLYSYDTRMEAFRTRYMYSDSIDAARDWLVGKFLEFGYSNVYIDEFYYDYWYFFNVVCVKNGTVEPDKVIVVGGHYDSYNLDSDPMIYAPGADDNASGTATVLELARIFKDVATDKTIMFVAFSAEEFGMWGSSYMAENLYYMGTDVAFMANFDMVAFTEDAFDNVTIFSGSITETYDVFASAAERVTTLIPYYGGISGGSDQVPFDWYGWPVGYGQEGDFNFGGWHTNLDISSRLDFPYFEQVVRMGAAALMHIDKAAPVVTITEVLDLGNGHSLRISWEDCSTDFSYNIIYGTQSGIYTDTINAPPGLCTYDVSGLTTGQIYYFAVSAETAEGYGPLYLLEESGIPYNIPLAPQNVTLDIDFMEISLNWRSNTEYDMSHYLISRRPADGIWSTLDYYVPDTFFVDLTVDAHVAYEYTVIAMDSDLNKSDSSSVVGGTAASFDLPLLFVDETSSGGAINPPEAGQQALYGSLFAPWDHDTTSIGDTPALTRSLAGQYSNIFWFDDDVSGQLFSYSLDSVAWYLSYNNNFCLAGFQTIYWVTGSDWLYSGNIMYDQFGIHRVTENDNFDFVGAEGHEGWPDLETRTDHVFGGILPVISVFDTLPGVQVIYTYNSNSDDPAFQGKPVGIVYETENGKRVALSFPIYHLTEESSHALVAKICACFGLFSGDPDIALSDSLLDYDSVFIGGSLATPLTVSNWGNNILTITGITNTHPDFSVTVPQYTVNPNESVVIPVTFSPGSVGELTDTVTITSDDPDEPILSVALQGIGVEPPVISANPETFDEDLLSGDSAKHILTVVNNGVSDLEFELGVMYHDDRLSALAAQCVDGITMTEEVVVDNTPFMTFSESESAQFEANLETFYQQAADLLGKEDIPNIAVVGSYSSSMVYYLMTDSLLASRYLFHNVYYYYDYSMIEPYDGLIICEYDAGFSYNEALAVSTFYDSGKPVILGMDDLDNEPPSIQALLFPVFGISGAFDGIYYWGSLNPYNPITEGITEVYSYSDGDNDWFTMAGADWIYSGDDGNYHGVSYEGEARTVLMGERLSSVWYVGNGPLIANAIDWMMGVGSWLSVLPEEGILPADNSLDIEVSFNASRLVTAYYDADIVIASNDPINPEISIPAHLHVSGIADIDLSDDLFDFGTVFIGAVAIDSLTIYNRGTDTLNVTNIACDVSDYTVDISGFLLPPGENQIVQVAFEPLSAGPIPSTLTVNCDDPDEPMLALPLQGAGAEPPVISADPMSLQEYLFRDDSAEQVITVFNDGVNDLTFTTRIVAAESLVTLASQCLDGITMTEEVEIDDMIFTTFSEFENAQFQSNLNTYHQSVNDLTGGRGLTPIAVVGSYSSSMVYYLLTDPSRTSQYLFFDVYWYDDYSMIDMFDGLIICENDNAISYNEALAVSAFCNSGRPVLMGMDDLDNEPASVKTLLFPVFGISNAFDGEYFWGSLNPDNPITEGISVVYSYSDTDNDWYTLSGADWIYSGTDGNYHGVSYDGATARTVLMGERLSTVWGAGNGPLIANAIDWMMARTGWLSIYPRAATIPSGGSIDINALFRAKDMEPGEHNINIVISSNDPINPEIIIPAMLQVMDLPTITVIPEPLYSLYMYTTETMLIDIYLPEAITAYSIYDIDTSTVRINDVFVPCCFEHLVTDSVGDFLKMSLDVVDFLEWYPLLWDTSQVQFSISGTLTDYSDFLETASVTVIGHLSGDINLDGNVNLLDILYLVDYIYADGPDPKPVIDAADLDESGSVNFLELMVLIDMVYSPAER
ncbi:MAG: M20/M25/M40 family metallo-hydrolase [Candidatus Zixiibacteriota bacterium]|nr:MAG: M20/M25/M40 family metallo-hydrolase [candidate division Zixibacteria bacterium]